MVGIVKVEYVCLCMGVCIFFCYIGKGVVFNFDGMAFVSFYQYGVVIIVLYKGRSIISSDVWYDFIWFDYIGYCVFYRDFIIGG